MKLIQSTLIATAASAVLGLLSTGAALAQDDTAAAPVTPKAARAAEYIAITRCAWCHGANGYSISPIYPALGGQKAWYIREQLHAFKSQTRADPYARGMMWGMAAQLDDATIDALADYYSKQAPFTSAPAPFSFIDTAKEIQRGANVYNQGVPADGVAPCSACHQEHAEGNEQFPRLAGQHASYLLKQLYAFHVASREQVVMNGITGPLKWEDMQAVSFYLEALR